MARPRCKGEIEMVCLRDRAIDYFCNCVFTEGFNYFGSNNLEAFRDFPPVSQSSCHDSFDRSWSDVRNSHPCLCHQVAIRVNHRLSACAVVLVSLTLILWPAISVAIPIAT